MIRPAPPRRAPVRQLLSTLPLLLLLLHLSTASAQPTPRDREAAVRGEVEEARARLAGAREALTGPQARLPEAREALRAAEAARDEAAERLLAMDRELAALRSSAEAATSQIDAEVARYAERAEALERSGAPASEIAEARRYLAAYRNMRSSRLERLGITDELRGLRQARRIGVDRARRAEEEVAAREEQVRAARESLDAAREAVAEQELALARILDGAAERLGDVAPPLLERVEVLNPRGATRYAAAWVSRLEEHEAAIERLERNIEEQREVVELRKSRVAGMLDPLEVQNREAQRLLDEYVSLVGGEDSFLGGGWLTWRQIFIEMGDATYSIMSDLSAMGPYAVFVEAGFQIKDALTGAKNKGWDVLKMNGIRVPSETRTFVVNDSCQLVLYEKRELAGGDGGGAGGGTGFAPWGKEMLNGAVGPKKMIKSAVKGAMIDPRFGMAGEGIYSTAKRQGITGLADAGKLWYAIEREVVGGREVTWAAEASLLEGVEGYARMLRESPRDFFGRLRGQVLSSGFMEGTLENVAQGLVVRGLKEWLVEGPRKAAWFEYLKADWLRQSMLTSLQLEARMRDIHQCMLDRMNEALVELIEEKDEARSLRDLAPETDEVLTGNRDFTLELTFDRPVTVESVTLGGRPVGMEAAATDADGAAVDDGNGTAVADGEGATVARGTFRLVGLPEVASLEVSASDPLTRKALDDPRTVSRYAATREAWHSYEPGPDTNHRVKLTPLRSGVSLVLLLDGSGSMGEEGRMEQAKRAARELLASERVQPDDEVALVVFYDCSAIRVVQPFTTDHGRIVEAVEGVRPAEDTPLAAGVRFAGDYLHEASRRDRRALVVLTDGQESCDGNVLSAVAEVRRMGQRVMRPGLP